MQRKLKTKKCKACKGEFVPISSLSKACSVPCAIELSKQDKAKKAKQDEKRTQKEHREAKAKLNDTVPKWTKKAQFEFNKYIRLRDHLRPCVSCGRHEHELTTDSLRGGSWDCGHYRSVGSCPELRFEPLNAHKQCKKCNSFDSGNHVEYRFGIAKRLTSDELAYVEGPHEPKRYRVPELKEITVKFRAMAKELKDAIDN